MILIGLILIFGGLIVKYFGKNLSWAGNLPGDIRIEKGNFKFYFPFTTLILFSLALNIIIRIINYIK